MKAIINSKLVMEDGIIWDGVVLVEDGIITAAGEAGEITIPDCAEIIDACGKYTAPGLVDIHNHGSESDLFSEEPESCSEHFLHHGETTVLPAFYCNMTLQEMIKGAERVREARKSGASRIIAGLYMEGPYMNGVGSNQKDIKWGGAIEESEFAPLVAEVSDLARVWAIDPAREGIERFMRYVREGNRDIIFALGHSFATSEDCRRVAKYGVRLQTHHSDSGKAKGRAQGTPGAGCDEFALYTPDVYTELICDVSGVHVVPDLIKLVIKTKGVERVCLITDSMPSKEKFTNNEADGIWYGPDLNYDYEGHLAGSHLTLDAACRNLMKHTGYGLCHAIRMASLNPARLLGIDNEVGSIESGKKANLIIIDDAVNVEKVLFEGEEIKI